MRAATCVPYSPDEQLAEGALTTPDEGTDDVGGLQTACVQHGTRKHTQSCSVCDFPPEAMLSEDAGLWHCCA